MAPLAHMPTRGRQQGRPKAPTRTPRLRAHLRELELLVAMGKLTDFLAMQIRNPLTNIALLSDQIARRVQDAEVLERLSRIDAQRRIVTDFVSEILRLTSPRGAPPSTFDLRGVVRVAADTVRPHRRAEVDLHVDLGKRRALVFGDSVRIREALAVVLKSAFASTRKGAVTVRLESDRGRWRVVMKDTSPGMPREVAARAFEPQASSERTGDGLGLGLFFAKLVMQGHGGDIELSSEIGYGSTFTITLPFAGDATA